MKMLTRIYEDKRINTEIQNLNDEVKKLIINCTEPSRAEVLKNLSGLMETTAAKTTEPEAKAFALDDFKMLVRMYKTDSVGRKAIEATAMEIAASKAGFFKMDKGKAKQVWITPGDPNVLFTAMAEGKIKEIHDEVKTTDAIKINHLKILLKDPLANKLRVSEKFIPSLAASLIKQFPNVDTLVDQIQKKPASDLAKILNIEGKQASALKNLFNHPDFRTNAQKKLKQVGAHLALDLKELTEKDKLEGQYTVKTLRAGKGSLEKIIRGNEMSFAQIAQLGLGFLSGMRDLHDAGYVHGDLKPENVLVYKDKEGHLYVKISDFGKSQHLDENEDAIHTGNPRFASPEGKISKKGEVYSSALVLIRMLEEQLLPSEDKAKKDLEETMLTTPSKKGLSTPKEDRRGIERFLIQNKACDQTESKFVVVGGIIKSAITGKRSLNTEAQAEVHRYIDVLVDKLKNEHPTQQKDIGDLGLLLKDMTHADYKKRPPMDQVVDRFQGLNLF